MQVAGNADFADRWGAEAELDAAAGVIDTLRAKYGPRPDVTEYPTGLVLKTMAMKSDQMRMTDLANRHMQKRQPA